MDRVAGIRPGRSCAQGSRIPQWNPGKSTRRVGPHNAGVMQASAGRSHTDVNVTTYKDSARGDIPPGSPLYQFASTPHSPSPRCCSPISSPVSAPTPDSFESLSPRSPGSTVQTIPSPTAAFAHSRESTLVLDAASSMHEVAALGGLLEKSSISSASGGQHRQRSASFDMPKLHRHRRFYSKFFSPWRRHASRIHGISDSSDFGSVEDEDDGPRVYRREVEVAARGVVDAGASNTEAWSNVINVGDDDIATTFTGAENASELSADEDSTPQADRVAKLLLYREFNLFLGSSEPPREIVEAVCKCLDDIGLSVRSARSMGVLPSHNAAAPSTECAGSASFGSSSRENGRRSGSSQNKRHMRDRGDDDEDLQDEEGEDGCGITGRNHISHRKRPKVEQYPCPFRKRSPYRFNCREWEVCARAPFKTMSELKKHIIKYHRQQHEPLAYVCVRCHTGFVRQEEWESHMLVSSAEMCDVREGPRPPLEIVGITSTVVERLRSRSEHFDWERLWHALFPDDPNVPDPDFEPVVDLYEVDHEYRALLPEFQTRLLSLIEASWPGMDAGRFRHLQVVNGNLENLFKEFVATAFDRARTNAAESSPKPRAQGTVTDTPSPAPPRAASVPDLRRPPFARPTHQRPILPNPAHRLSDSSSADTYSSSARYSTSTIGLEDSNCKSLASNTRSQENPSHTPTLAAPLPIHRDSSSLRAWAPPLRDLSSASAAPARSPLGGLLSQRSTTQPPLRELTLVTHKPHQRRFQEPRQEEGMAVPAAAGNTGAKHQDPRDSAVYDLDLVWPSGYFGDNAGRRGSDGELVPSSSGVGVHGPGNSNGYCLQGTSPTGYMLGVEGLEQPDGPEDWVMRMWGLDGNKE